MRSIIKPTVLVAFLAGHLAVAGEGQQPAPIAATPPATVAESVRSDDARGPVELLVGGLGAVGGGYLGFAIGSRNGLFEAGVGMLTGVALGSWLGTSLGGGMMGGKGNLWLSLLGTLAGSGLSLVFNATIGSSAPPPVTLGMTVILPLMGAITGYEASHQAATSSSASRGQPWRFTPTFALTRDGKGATTGIAGAF
jgi:hypothetical protein